MIKDVKILVANGVNLDLLGRREADVYGRFTLADLAASLQKAAPEIAKLAGLSSLSLSFFQSNVEAEFLSELDKGWSGILMNPGAWTHTSLALADRLAALRTPYVEVHISNVAAREEFRKHSYSAKGASGVVHGFGMHSYHAALLGLCARLAST